MSLRHELTYEAGVAEVFAMLCDTGFREQVSTAIGATEQEATISGSDTEADPVVIALRRRIPTPELARKFVGDTLEMVQNETWGQPAADGSRTAELAIDIPGKPGSLRGHVDLRPTGSGTSEVVAGEVRVKLPLVGAMLEKEITKGLVAAIEAEGRVGRRWLAQS